MLLWSCFVVKNKLLANLCRGWGQLWAVRIVGRSADLGIVGFISAVAFLVTGLASSATTTNLFRRHTQLVGTKDRPALYEPTAV